MGSRFLGVVTAFLLGFAQEERMTDVCIVGGGLAGASAASVLDDASLTVYEADAIGGRTASRERDGCHYDIGANFLELGDDDVEAHVLDVAGDALREIDGPIWLFDAAGEVSPERSDQNTRWCGTTGLDAIPRAMFEDADATVHEDTTVNRLLRADDGWTVRADGDRTTFDALVLAVPAGSASLLLGRAEWESDVRERVHEAAGSIPQRPMDAVVLHYPFDVEREYFGLVSADALYDVAWVSLEGAKPGYVPDGESVVCVQFDPSWTDTHPQIDPAVAAEAAADRAAALLDDDRLLDFDWFDYLRWSNAIPSRGPETDVLAAGLEHDLAVAGDWTQGIGRTRAAVQSGLRAGERLADRY